MPVVLDLTQTAHCPAHTGVQRVCRQLLAALAANGADPVALINDPYARRWRVPDTAERALLSPAVAENPGHRRSEVWTAGQRLRGFLRRGAEPDWAALRGAPLLAPEIFSADVFTAYAELRSRLGGAVVTVFHDAVALRFPELTPPASVARATDYLRELAGFDGVAADSQASKADLLEQWTRLGVRQPPPVEAIPLAVDAPSVTTSTRPTGAPLILCVGTIEGRKNHLALLEAAESLWAEGAEFRLALAGLPRPETASPALFMAANLQNAGRPLDLLGVVPESHLQELYAECRFTVYPSLYEGFGLPVAESLRRGRPCVCGRGGALAEMADGGGCLVVAEPSSSNLADAIRTLLGDPALQSRLAAEAAARRFPSWMDYARQLLAWAKSLRPRESR
jgi:glycosyltransferase involved in cell wall biosynthesis